MIRDIALLALHLAHATDDDLSQSEVEEMSASLQHWRREETDPTVPAAIKSSLETYVQAGAEEAVEAAIGRVQKGLSPADRAVLLADLTAIALADGTMLDAEVAFLDRLGAAWEISGVGEEMSRRVSERERG